MGDDNDFFKCGQVEGLRQRCAWAPGALHQGLGVRVAAVLELGDHLPRGVRIDLCGFQWGFLDVEALVLEYDGVVIPCAFFLCVQATTARGAVFVCIPSQHLLICTPLSVGER